MGERPARALLQIPLHWSAFPIRIRALCFCMDRSGFPRRPPRISPFQEMRLFYFVTFNTRNRQSLLATRSVHDGFVAFCEYGLDAYGVGVGRYVLMPDHGHLFVELPPYGPTLSNWVGQLKRRLRKQLSCSNPWQEGFFDHLLRSGESYAQKWEYVRQNPVRAGLCDAPEDWPWQGEIVPIRW